MDELIRKQDAIEAVNDVLAEYISTFKPWQERIPLECALKIKALPAVQPNRGRWILDRSGAYCCSECMEPCAGYVMMQPRDKFCKMCFPQQLQF